MSGLCFTAIDFETANERRDSACQLAAVTIRDGQVVAQHDWLIRPNPLLFRSSHIAIHGITPLEVANCHDFSGLWPEIARALRDQVLVAHNALFDLGVLRACLATACLPTPSWSFACTRHIARRAWPGEDGYGLKAIANRLGIQFRHHDALEDAIACAKILIAASQFVEAETLEALETRLQLTRGQSTAETLSSPTTWGAATKSAVRRRPYRQPQEQRTNGNQTLRKRILALWTQKKLQRPLQGRQVVFTGHLSSLQREEAEQLVRDLGALVHSRVTRLTDLLVVGAPDPRTIRSGNGRSTKERQAEQLRESGHPVRSLDEEQFVDWLDAHCGMEANAE